MEAISIRQLQRPQVLGVDPRLVLVLEFHATIDPDELHRNGMVLLDGSDRHAIVAFADDPFFAVFHERLAAYRGPIPEGQKSPPYQAFFDSILKVRLYGPEDRISDHCAAFVSGLTRPETLRLDVQCWHPDDANLAGTWLNDLRSATKVAGGEVVSTYQNDSIGVLLARVLVPSDRLSELADLDVIASIDLLPATALTRSELHNISVDNLPPVTRPARNAPILGLIDSGVASAHPLLAGAVQSAESLSPHISDGEDRNGHGTMVAALALHGPIPEALRQARLVPIARIVSVAVLDSECAFPDDSLWEQDLAQAIQYCAGQGARVINLSLGDATRPFRPPRQHAVSAIVDQLARLHDLVIVTCTGNTHPTAYLDTASAAPAMNFVVDLLAHPDTTIIPPGTSALSLTVGGFGAAASAGGYVSREPVERRPYGPPGWPSSVTRRGPGIEGAIKPELVAPSGTHAYEPTRAVVEDHELGIVSAGIGIAGRILGVGLGTSYAAPLVSRVALGVLNRFPEFSANLTRALVLLGARPTWTGEDLQIEGTARVESHRREAVRQLSGYGSTSVDRTLEVSTHRAVLVADGSIEMNAIHIYELPIPDSFHQSGGKRSLDVALAFDPPARTQRLDYLGNKLEMYVVRDIQVDELIDIFAKDAVEGVEETDEPVDDEIGDTETARRPGITQALGSRLITLDSSVSARSRSANQRAGTTFSQRFQRPAEGRGAFIVIRSLNRWCDNTLTQGYALAVSLERDPDQPEIYAELAARLEAVAEVEIGIESEVEL